MMEKLLKSIGNQVQWDPGYHRTFSQEMAEKGRHTGEKIRESSEQLLTWYPRDLFYCMCDSDPEICF